MTWDGEKSRGDELTSSEWNDHVADQKGHSERHGSGGIDEISVEGLSGDLADDQDPKEGVTRDIVEVFLDGGNNVTVSRSADTLTIDTSALNDQEVADKVGAVVEGGTQTTVSYDSGTQTATITIDAPSQSEFDNHSERHEKGGSDELTNFGDTTHDLVSTDEATIGSGSTVTGGPVGDSGEWVPVTVLRFGGASFDVTSTTFTTFSSRENRVVLNTSNIDLTNISDLAISLTATISTDTSGESTTWRLSELGGQEFEASDISTTGTTATANESNRDSDLNDSSIEWVVLQGKVGTSGPTGTIYNPQAIIWGKIA